MSYKKSLLSIGLALLGASCLGGASDAIILSEFVEAAPKEPEVHSSTITEVSPGVFLAAWFGGAKEADKDTQIWGARRTAEGWGESFVIEKGLDDKGEPTPVYNPSLYTHKDGRVTLFYFAGIWEGGVKKYCMKDSTDGGLTWSPERLVPKNLHGPCRAKPLLLSDGSLLYPTSGKGTGYTNWSDEAMTPESWGSSPGAKDPGKLAAFQPTLLQKNDGTVLMFFRSNAREIGVARSTDLGRTWSPIKGIGIYKANSAIDVLKLRDGRCLLIYNKTPKPAASSKSWGPRHPLTLALSTDEGETWRDLFNIETDKIREGFAYPTMIQAGDGSVHITYTWGRKRIKHVVIDPAKL